MNPGWMRRTASGLLIACGLLTGPAGAAEDDKGFSLGLQVKERAALSELGLPDYPGAVPYSDSQGDKSAVTLGAWAGSFGLRVSAMSFQVAESPATVAAFYVKALAQHGTVLDCREPAARAKPPKDSGQLRCDGEAPRKGEYEFRVGTDKLFRTVHVKPHGDGTRFVLARISLGN